MRWSASDGERLAEIESSRQEVGTRLVRERAEHYALSDVARRLADPLRDLCERSALEQLCERVGLLERMDVLALRVLDELCLARIVVGHLPDDARHHELVSRERRLAPPVSEYDLEPDDVVDPDVPNEQRLEHALFAHALAQLRVGLLVP